jgi:acyl-coenzyme A synthetase/AMP-(fatty) acid ligase
MPALWDALRRSLEDNHSRTAIKTPDGDMAYGDLLRASLRTAADLRSLPHSPRAIAIMIPRSARAVCSAIAVWCSLAVPVFLDQGSGTVAERIIRQIRPCCVVADSVMEGSSLSLLRGCGYALAHMGPLVSIWVNEHNCKSHELGRDAGYIVATSGTTGETKAVVGSDPGLAAYCDWQISELSMKPGVRCAHITDLSFDFAFKEVWPTLLSGGSVVVAAADVTRSSSALDRWLQRSRINVACLLPSRLGELVHRLGTMGGVERQRRYAQLRHLLISGEPLPSELVMRWQALMGNGTQLHNLYGPAESNVVKLHYRIPYPYAAPCLTVPIGKPICGVKVTTRGTADVGELLLQGKLLAVGYHPAARPRRDGFAAIAGSERHFVTGDIVRRCPDGHFEFVDRTDRIVKRRGIAVSLGAVEVTARKVPHVGEAAAVAVSDGTARVRVWLYYVAAARQCTPLSVRSHLARALPMAHLPDAVRPVPALPKNRRGKTDYKEIEMAVASELQRAQGPQPS